MFIKKRNKSKGFTLVEILLVIGFISLASVTIYTIYNAAAATVKANDESNKVAELAKKITGAYAATNAYTGVSAPVLIANNLAPASLWDGVTANMLNGFGGTVTVAPSTQGTGATANNSFAITYPLVTSEVCQKFVTTSAARFQRIDVNGVAVQNLGVNLNIATLSTQCAPNTNTIILYNIGTAA